MDCGPGGGGRARKLNWTKPKIMCRIHSLRDTITIEEKKTEIWFSMEICEYQNKRFSANSGRPKTIRTNLNGKLIIISRTSTVDWHDAAVDMQLFMIAFGNDVDDGGGEQIKRKSIPSGVRTSHCWVNGSGGGQQSHSSFALHYRVAWNEPWNRDNHSVSASSLIGRDCDAFFQCRGQHPTNVGNP